ncbi:PurB Adenylosuccinate lyase [uncultured Caudovirales phage]|uniref:PurB Adenylosuccinate lyase n=1 Tax=uncultured Caudovirales phage TaxID=2100421 RepID=A0A6J5SKK6_9CAUD|nr:PurB Adenylosuccinate lyase [uncultured Caudovirales phage]CAB4219637.1 PurB Adenylosuccinate lyase [uncultured Caudovirales phage]
MIERYCSSEMAAVWSDASKWRVWLAIEIAVLKARCMTFEGNEDMETAARELGKLPPLNAQDVARHEAILGHDVMAFIAATLVDTGSPQVHQWLHYGLTSSDVVETGQAILLRRANRLVMTAAREALEKVTDLSLAQLEQPYLGRTHGQSAEPTSLGLYFADFAFAIQRSITRLDMAAEQLQLAHISGPLGNYAQTSRNVEEYAARLLGLYTPTTATQVIRRDNLAHWAYCMANLATVCEAFALAVRLGSQTMVNEMHEGYANGRLGSSSMPHKQNPVSAERICGQAKLVRSLVMPITEGIALWDHRDISHSSVERVALPDLCALTEHILTSTAKLAANLVIEGDQMEHTAKEHQGSASEMNFLIRNGYTRKKAYETAAERKDEFVVYCPPPATARVHEGLLEIQRSLASIARAAAACRFDPTTGKVL